MLKSFKIGGVFLNTQKTTAHNPICTIDIPDQVVILLNQHVGAPCQPVVKRGDVVKVGTLIGKAVGFVSANIHSSVSGTVLKIDKAIDATGSSCDAVFIKVVGDDWEELIDRSPELKKECTLSPNEILKKIAAAGVVGMGGTPFPTHVKLTPPPGYKSEILIVNGVESEPWLTSNHRIMIEKAKEIMVGITLTMKALDIKKVIIGIENDKKDAIELFREQAKSIPGISVEALKVKYPQGAEKLLVEALTGRRLPSRGLPISTGIIVLNMSTIFAIYEAVQKNKPLIERIVTVTGKEIKKPSNILSRIGVPASTLIEACGGYPETTGKVISGGPMMGKAIENTNVPITKETSGILLIPVSKTKPKVARDCIRCGKCIDVCPMGLDPSLLMKLTESESWQKAEKEYITDCLECGACEYICPSNLPLLSYIQSGKNKVNTIVRSRID